VRSLADMITAEDCIESEKLTTLFVVVPKSVGSPSLSPLPYLFTSSVRYFLASAFIGRAHTAYGSFHSLRYALRQILPSPPPPPTLSSSPFGPSLSPTCHLRVYFSLVLHLNRISLSEPHSFARWFSEKP